MEKTPTIFFNGARQMGNPHGIVGTFEELDCAVKHYPRGEWVFRGQGDYMWELKPSVGRTRELAENERRSFEAWKRIASQINRRTDESASAMGKQSDMYWLALAQHHGVATRLLDWSTDPLTAAYFAASSANKNAAVIYALKLGSWLQPFLGSNPLDIQGVAKVEHVEGIDRLESQSGLFTIHEEPNKPFNSSAFEGAKLEEIMIEASCCDNLIKDLDAHGYNAARLFPDLEGAARYIRGKVTAVVAPFPSHVLSEEERHRSNRRHIAFLKAEYFRKQDLLEPAKLRAEQLRQSIVGPINDRDLNDPNYVQMQRANKLERDAEGAVRAAKCLINDIFALEYPDEKV